MKRPRPYIPLKVRVQVAWRQLQQKEPHHAYIMLNMSMHTQKLQLAFLLEGLFGSAQYALDHNPALALRKFNRRTGKYTPDANDPAHLVYREQHDHHIKTNVRGDGAQYSDVVLMKRQRRRERKQYIAALAGKPVNVFTTMRKIKRKIAQRKEPWQKRKMRNR